MKLRIRYNHWLPKRLGVAAITLYPFVLFAWDSPSESLWRHEMVHVEQVRRIGWLRFYVSYLVIYFGYRVYGWGADYSYSALPHEVEAVFRSKGND